MHRYDKHLQRFFYYDESSDSFLKWRVSTTKSVLPNSDAGTFDGKYWNVKLHGKLLKVHKVIWALHNEFKDQTNMEIDHFDGKTENNKNSNLRLVTRKVNMQNRNISATANTSGIFGVRQRVDVNGSIRYVAFWMDLKGKHRSKTFAVNKYGDALAREMAIQYRKNQIELLNNSGAGYTERHGSVV
jgi:hypothetical protein